MNNNDIDKNEKISICVAVNGSDKGDGSLNNPFATVERARDEVRHLKNKHKNKDIYVIIRGGIYYLEKTICFGLEDSGNENQKIIYCAYENEKPIFSSGRRISDWKKLENEVEGICPNAKGKIWTASLPQVKNGEWKFYSLYDGEKRLIRARSKGFAPVNQGADWKGSFKEHTTVCYPDNAPFRNWDNISDIELIVRGVAAWQMSVLPLEGIDTENKVATLSTPCLYIIGQMKYWNDISQSIWIENAIDFIDEEGKWAVDFKKGVLYYWPLGDKPSDNIVAPLLKEYIKVEGEINYDEQMDIPVKNIEFNGLSFIHGERDTWPADYRGYEMQHSWDMYDRENAMVRFRGAENCVITNCSFYFSSGGAVRLDLYAQKNRIYGNRIFDIGGCAITLCGYGPGIKNVNRLNEIINNEIFETGKIYWHSPAIFVWQSGQNTVSNNLIHNVPYCGIAVSGRIVFTREIDECSKTIRWNEIDENVSSFEDYIPYLHSRDNLISNNELHHIGEIIADGDGIYISGCGRGNRIKNNYIHHCPSIHFCEGIRCDDIQVDTFIEGNIIFKIGGMSNAIVIKGRNHIINNIIFCDVSKDSVGHKGLICLEIGPTNGSVINNNILYSTKSYHNAYFQDRTYGEGPIPKFKHTMSDYNVFYNEEKENWGSVVIEEERKNGIELNSVEADPLFNDIHNGDFLLKENSPALKLGFKQIDVTKIGLIKLKD